MTTIWKFPLDVTDEQTVEMPAGSEILVVQVQNDQPCIWARVDPEAVTADRRIFVYGTGHIVSPSAFIYLGTFQLHNGAFVGHVFSDRP